jgi:hypothetical protein
LFKCQVLSSNPESNPTRERKREEGASGSGGRHERAENLQGRRMNMLRNVFEKIFKIWN